MKYTKGFKKKYFSLAAILACTVSVDLSATTNSIKTIENNAIREFANDQENEENEIDVANERIIYVTAINEKKSKEYSSSRTSKPNLQTTELVQIITKDEIELKGFQNLPQALNTISGISITSNGGTGQSSSAYIRGLNPAHTLVMINSIRMNDPTGLSGAQIELIDLDNIERIEILKGPQSGIWGADASGGVINIITSGAKKDGVSANTNIEFGSNAWQKYGAGFEYNNEVFDISIFGNYLNTKGISAAAPKKFDLDYGKDAVRDLGFERDRFESRTLGIQGGVNINQNDRLEFFIRNNRSINHFDAGAGNDADDYDSWGPYFNTIRTNIYSLGYVGTYDKHKIDIKASLSDFDRKFYGGYKGRIYEAYISDEFNYINNGMFVFGGGFLRDEVKLSTGLKLPHNSQDNKYIFLNNTNTFSNFVFSQSIRYDNYDRFDNKLTGKIGLRYNFFKDWFVLTNYKTGYKTPTLYQQTYGLTSNLDAEKTNGYEISFGNNIFDITYFDTRVRNAIEYGGFWPNDYYYNLDGKSRFKGIEINFRHDIYNLIFAELSYTYLHARDNNNKNIARRPKHKIDGSIIYFVNNKINMNFRGSFVGSRYDTNDVQTGKYFLADYILNLEPTKNVSTYFKVHNLFDRYYQEIDGYSTYGRSFYIGVRVKY